MLVEVRLMRHQGRRLPWRDIDTGKAYRGDLLPPLHEPMLTGFGADVFHLRGIERLELADGVHGVVQEWRCTPVR